MNKKNAIGIAALCIMFGISACSQKGPLVTDEEQAVKAEVAEEKAETTVSVAPEPPPKPPVKVDPPNEDHIEVTMNKDPFEQVRGKEIIFFDFNSSNIKAEATNLIDLHANFLVENPDTFVVLEGHADERGTREYNIALGERRAHSIKDLLLNRGVPEMQISSISYGEEKPLMSESNEIAWSKNRRAVFVYAEREKVVLK